MNRSVIHTVLCALLFGFLASASWAEKKKNDIDVKSSSKDAAKTESTARGRESATADRKDDSKQKDHTVTPAALPTDSDITLQLDQVQQTITAIQTGEKIYWQAISSGGGYGTSTNYQLTSVIGQTAVGTGSSTNYTIRHGYLQNFGSGGGCCVGTTGNVDFDPGDVTDIADLTTLIDHLFITFPPLACTEEANVDGDPSGIVDIADLTTLIDHLFITFPPLPACP